MRPDQLFPRGQRCLVMMQNELKIRYDQIVLDRIDAFRTFRVPVAGIVQQALVMGYKT